MPHFWGYRILYLLSWKIFHPKSQDPIGTYLDLLGRKKKPSILKDPCGDWNLLMVFSKKNIFSLSQWLNLAKLFGDYIFSRENKPFKLFFSGSRTAKWVFCRIFTPKLGVFHDPIWHTAYSIFFKWLGEKPPTRNCWWCFSPFPSFVTAKIHTKCRKTKQKKSNVHGLMFMTFIMALQNSLFFCFFPAIWCKKKIEKFPSLKGISSSNHWNSQGQTGC